MWSFLSTSIAIAAAVQVEPHEWIARLTDADAAVREEATRWLIDNGASLRDHLEALLSTSEPETRARVQHILVMQDRNQRIAAFLGSRAHVTLTAHEEDAVEVLLRMREQTGLRFRLSGVPLGRALTVNWTEVDPFEAILEVCELHGGIWFDPWRRTVWRGQRSIFHARNDRWHAWLIWDPTEAVYQDEETGEDTLTLPFGLLWTGPAPREVKVDIKEISDSSGVLHPVAESSGYRVVAPDSLCPEIHLGGRYLSPEAEWFTISGEARFRYALQFVEDRFDWDKLEILTRLAITDGYVHVRERDGCVVATLNVPSSLLADLLEVKVLDTGGQELTAGPSSYFTGHRASHTYRFPMPRGAPPSAVLVRRITDVYEVSVPFRFDRIPIRRAED